MRSPPKQSSQRSPFPPSTELNPSLHQWVDFSLPGTARIFSGKVELGQGILTALVQIAAEELRLPAERVALVSGDTDRCPNEMYTAGSYSVEMGGRAVKTACAEARKAIIEEAARRLNERVEKIAVAQGRILIGGAESELDFWEVAAAVNLHRPLPAVEDWAPLDDCRIVGQSLPRLDLPAKVTGAAFVHDVQLPAMLHARVLHPPAPGAHLESLDGTRVEKLPGVAGIYRSGDFVAVMCEKEFQAVRALEALRRAAMWSNGTPIPDIGEWGTWLRSQPSDDTETESGQRLREADEAIKVSARYSRPLLAHASIGPACGVAQYRDGHLTVWTNSQGVFPLRGALAKSLDMEEDRISVIHVQGAGSYGHNGADDAACEAAVLALHMAPRPVRVQWMRDDDLTSAPFGAPMAQKMEGAVTPDGRIADWQMDVWSGPHVSRPGFRGHVNLLGAALKDPSIPFATSRQEPGFFAGSDRNAEALYDLPRQRIALHRVHVPFRTSSLRTLGGFGNVFAIECFMDELAEAAGIDPVAFRLRHLSDSRARRVVEAVAALANWNGPGGDGTARGVGFSRYKNTAAYAAMIADVEVKDDIRVAKVYAAVDAGLAISPDGVKNQIEGGIVQSLSWTLKEQVAFDHSTVTSNSWATYPILSFDETPEINIVLVGDKDGPPLGVGEAAQGPAAAAVANGAARALGIRIRDLPITRERIMKESG